MKESRRVKMTKKLIKDAFLTLTEKTPINKVTVKQICEKADVNRSTFYAHYADQYDLFEEIQGDIISITPSISLYKKQPIFKALTNFLNFIDKNKKIYRILFSNSVGADFRNSILNKVFNRDGNSIDWINDEMNLANSMHFKMLMCGFGGMTMIENWIFDRFEASPEDLATYMTEYINNV